MPKAQRDDLLQFALANDVMTKTIRPSADTKGLPAMPPSPTHNGQGAISNMNFQIRLSHALFSRGVYNIEKRINELSQSQFR